MDKLLKWSLNAGSAPDGTAVEAPDPKLMAELFGGKDEAQQMKDNMTVILHPEADREDKLVAFDNFEMLIENLDNANNIQPLGMWQHLIGLLDSKDPEFRKQTCWIIGTAVQNNEPAQKHLLESRPLQVIPKLLEIAADHEKEERDVRIKAIYALTSELGHNPAAYSAFVEAGGWNTVSVLFDDAAGGDLKVRARALSLLRVLLTIEPVQDETHSTLRKETTVVPTLVGPVHLDLSAAPDLRDRTLGLISILQEAGFEFTDAEKKQGQTLIEELRVAGEIEQEEYKFWF